MAGYTVFLIVMEVWCCITLFQSFAEKRRSKFISVVQGCILGFFYLVITAVFRRYFYFRIMALISVTSIIMFLMFQIRYLKAVVLSMLCYGLDIMTEYAAIVIFGKAYFLILGQTFNLSDLFFLNILSVISKIGFLGIVLLIRKMIGGKSSDILTSKEWWILFVISSITIFSISAITTQNDFFENTNQRSFLLIIAMGMLIINLIVYYLVNDIMERETRIREDKAFKEKIKNEKEMYYSISENLDKQRKRTHEYKNQINCIAALAVEKKYKELSEYIEKIDNNLKIDIDTVDTNNMIVNAILNTKYREAIEKGVVFVLKVNDLSNLKIRDEDIVIILSNLLNNALEACESCQDRVIKFKLVLEEDQIVISIKNNMGTELVMEKGKFLTTKVQEPDEHGMGIQNVIDAIKKYDGRYIIDCDKGVFEFSILMSNHFLKE